MAKKGLSVWLFSSLTFISLLHLIDATYSLFFNAKFHLLQLYPFINEKMQTITPTTYFWVTAVATLILWGITCIIAFENPVETFLNKILSDARTQSAVETQILEEKSEILDLMNETIESNTKTLAQVRDLVFNVRTEVKEIQPIKEHIEKIEMELSSMKKEFSKFKDKVKFATICPACGKPLLPEFKLCPYCGEDIKLLPETVLPIGK